MFNEFDIRTYGEDRWSRGPLIATRFYKGGSAPQPQPYGQQISGELQAKTQLAPQVFGTEAQFDPMYAALNNQLLQNTLFGTPTGTSLTVPTPGYADAMTNYNTALAAYNAGGGGASNPMGNVPGGNMLAKMPGVSGMASHLPGPFKRFFGGKSGNIAPNIPPPQAPTLSPTTTYSLPASRGIVDMANQAGTAGRAGNIADWSNLSPAALESIKQSNPQLARLIDSMTGQAQYQLGLGTNLSPAQTRQVTQGVRSQNQGMLGGTGNAGTYNLALGLSQFGQNLYQQRLGNAQNAAAQSAGYYTPQLNNLMNANYNPLGYLSAGGAQNSGIGPRLFGSDINAQNAFNTQYQGALSAYNAQQNNQAALTGAGVSGAAGLAGAGLLALALA